ncbi:MAG: NAD(P)H-dependent flavin oxidoreductase [Roseburia sp.]
MYKPLVIGDLTASVPIVQGGMGVGVSLENLASAVANCGGVGILSAAQIGYREEDYERNPVQTNLKAVGKYIKKAKEMVKKGGIIGINIMVATRYYEEYVKAAVKAKVDLIVSGAGLPVNLPEYTKGTTTKIAPIVSSEKAANVILKMWDKKYQTTADMLVIEGPEAGGHLGFRKEEILASTRSSFMQEIKKIMAVVKKYEEKYHKHIAVVAGGGIYNKQDAKDMMQLGLDGIQVATRFVTTVECDASDAFKNAYIHAKKEDIEIVESPVGMPGRAIQNPFLDEVKKGPSPISKCYQCIKGCNAKDIPYCISKALVNAVKGDIEHGLLFCGGSAYKAEKIETVREVIEDLMAD